jgi:hypothetical protein
MGSLISTLTDSQTWYIGPSYMVLGTNAARASGFIPVTGTVVGVWVFSYSGTAGSNEAWECDFRLNDTTDSLIASVELDTNERNWVNSAMSVAVSAGDKYELKFVNPAWATNPANMRLSWVVLIR